MFDLQDVEEQAVLHGGLIDREREFFLRAIDGVFGESERAEGEALRDTLYPRGDLRPEEEVVAPLCRDDVADDDGKHFEELARVRLQRGDELRRKYVAALFQPLKQGEGVRVVRAVFG